MFKLTGPQLGRLRREIEPVYAAYGLNGSAEFALFLLEMDVQLTDMTATNTLLGLQIAEVLTKLNTQGRMQELFGSLERAHPTVVDLLAVIADLRTEATQAMGGVNAAARLQALERALLLLDGMPFINRARLRQMLDALFDPANPARVGTILGASLAGKSWSVHLVRAYCDSVAQHKVRIVLLDLERLGAENDARIVWVELMRQLSPPAAPPEPPAADTKGGQYVQRLVDEVGRSWSVGGGAPPEERPWLLVIFDHFRKNEVTVGPAVVDFAEALAAAAVERRIEGLRVLLLGFPREMSGVLGVDNLAPREDIAPLSDVELKHYLNEVGRVIDRGPPPEMATAVELALREASLMAVPEERKTALLKMCGTISQHVNALARAT